jgi:hypothetical protein
VEKLSQQGTLRRFFASRTTGFAPTGNIFVSAPRGAEGLSPEKEECKDAMS